MALLMGERGAAGVRMDGVEAALGELDEREIDEDHRDEDQKEADRSCREPEGVREWAERQDGPDRCARDWSDDPREAGSAADERHSPGSDLPNAVAERVATTTARPEPWWTIVPMNAHGGRSTGESVVVASIVLAAGTDCRRERWQRTNTRLLVRSEP